jgi:hypothetical protein
MVSRILQRLALAAMLVGGVSLAAASSAEATRPARRTNRPTAARGFNLFAGNVNVLMNVNRVQCNVNNIGESCVDPNNSRSIGGGYWPRGTGNQYIFNSGLQIAGIIPGVKTASFPWPGDTVGAFFFDPRGDQSQGEGRTNTFNSLSADDLANWPSAANVSDTSLFAPALIGRQAASQQDTWVRIWDGNPTITSGRDHPMGLLVEQRGLMWNFPSGNQDIVYFLYRFINITTTDPARYAGLAAFGYSPQDITDIVAIATEFQQRNEAAFNVAIPDSGYTFTSLYASFAQDPDVGNANLNYSNANLPFNLAMVYKSDFQETAWDFRPDIHGAPFAAAPGFEAVKYLKSPQNIGIAIAGNTANGTQFPDAAGVKQLWRNLSGNLLPTDGQCSVPNPQVRHFCFWVQTPADTRFYESSGPFTMNPGESAVIVVAYIHAAPLGTAPAATPPFGPAISAFSLTPFVGGNMVPGFPLDGARLLSGADTLRNIDRTMGWLNHTNDLNANGRIDQNEVITYPRSLFNKAIVAQAVFDGKFLLPFAPEVPTFFLVPGNNQTTIAWQKSSTETAGDPYFATAANIASPLYDPNFRKFDVEGYRIWRGRTSANMEVIASFDYQGTTITDFTGQFFDGAVYGNQCAPELGVVLSCPAFPNAVLLSGLVQQVPPGGRVQLASGTIYNVVVDTAVTGGGSGLPALTDNGVPFAFVDNGVRNGFRYFYAVTAFDLNSVKSGTSSLESPLVTKTVTPRAPSSNNVAAVVVTGLLAGDGTPLDPNTPFPAIDPATGTFNGPIPPTNGGSIQFLASVSEALGPGNYVLRIDSVSPGSLGGLGTPGNNLYVTAVAGTQLTPLVLTLPQFSFSAAASAKATVGLIYPLVPYDSAQSRLLGIAFTQDIRMPVQLVANVANPTNGSADIGLQAGRFGNANDASRYLSHSRWMDGTASEPPQPTVNPFASPDHNSGKLTGVTMIFKPASYRLPCNAAASACLPAPGEAPYGEGISERFRSVDYVRTVWYPGDFYVTWGAAGAITVRDSTHRTTLPFNTAYGTGYGFTNAAPFVAAALTETELENVDACALASCRAAITPTAATVSYRHLYYHFPANVQRGRVRRDMEQTATLGPIDWSMDGVSDGTGIALTINSETWFFGMAALPATGTVWHLRAVGGDGMNATCTPALVAPIVNAAAAPTACSGYSFSPGNNIRPPYAPGIGYAIQVTQQFAVASTSGDLSAVHTVPDPYYVTNSLEQTANTKVLRFVNLPDRAIIRIYSASGILVNIVNHNNVQGGGEEVWNLRNRNNQFVASGVYYFHVEAPDGQTRVGRFTVVNYAQ